jgi:hypothetical protein
LFNWLKGFEEALSCLKTASCVKMTEWPMRVETVAKDC